MIIQKVITNKYAKKYMPLLRKTSILMITNIRCLKVKITIIKQKFMLCNLNLNRFRCYGYLGTNCHVPVPAHRGWIVDRHSSYIRCKSQYKCKGECFLISDHACENNNYCNNRGECYIV